MTVGAIALRAMETKPAPLYVTDLMAETVPLGAEFETDVPLNTSMWRHIVLHSTGGEGADILKRVHFVVDSSGTQLIRATDLWKAQRPANHVNSTAHNYNADSIAIALQGDFSRQGPSKRQLNELARLVRSLQQACNIDTSKVYLYRPDLSSGRWSPGKAFPARQFTSMLKRP
jgi:hypothetical protein